MEFLFYMVACLGVVAVCFPLFSIATSLERLTSVVQEGDRELVRAHVRVDKTYDSHGRQKE